MTAQEKREALVADSYGDTPAAMADHTRMASSGDR